MSEIGEVYRALDILRQAEGKKRRRVASEELVHAQRIANANGILLIRHTDQHYHLKVADITYDVWPGNMRIRAIGKGKPWLDLPEQWGLLDVVNAGIKLKEQNRE